MLFRGRGRSITRSVWWTVLICIFFIWFLCMLLLTLTQADALGSMALQSAGESVHAIQDRADRYFATAFQAPERPGALSWAAQESANQQPSLWQSQYGRRSFLMPPGGELRAQTAVLVVDTAGKAAAEPAGVLSFPYLDETGETAGYVLAYLDEQTTPDRDELGRVCFGDWTVNQLYDWNRYRFTGLLADGRLTLTGIQGQRESWDPWETLWEAEGGPAGETLLADPDHITWNIPASRRETPIFFSRELIYEDMAALLRDYVEWNQIQQGNQRMEYFFDKTKLTECIRVSVHWIEDESGAPRYCLLTGLRFSPLGYAMGRLKWVYLYTLLLVLLLPWGLGYRVKKTVETPLRTLNEDWDQDVRRSRLFGFQQPFRELERLVNHYDGMAARLADADAAQRRLQKAADFAQEAEQARRQMTANLAHELKTPLAVLHSYAEGLQEHIADEKRDQYLAVLLSETERMDAMVLEMLDLSRLEAGKVKLRKAPFSLSALAEAAIRRLELAAAAKELRVTFSPETDEPVNADEGRVEQAITNLLANAVRYTPYGGKVRVLIQRRERYLVFAVENDSAPLTEEALAQVWDSFYRAEEARTGTGAGLGLAITKSVIELHGGFCAARNIEGGVRFEFCLPG